MKLFSFLFLTIVLFSFSLGQNKGVTWTIEYNKEQLKPGNDLVVTFTGQVADGYKVFALSQTQDGLIPYAISLSADKKRQGATIGLIQEKSGTKKVQDDLMNAEVVYSDKKIMIQQIFRITAENPVVKGQLFYTFTDDNHNSQKKAFSFTVK